MADAFHPAFPESLIERIRRWTSLKRWERIELAQAIRVLGLSYSEIGALIPASRSSLSKWCRDVELGPDQIARLQSIRPGAEGRLAASARRKDEARQSRLQIREAGKAEAAERANDPFFVAGVVAYWSEGSKRSNEVQFSNSDPRLVALFCAWSREYLGATTQQFAVQMHLHQGQVESERRSFWSRVSGIPEAQFRKTFVKPEGTGHRKNVLYNGTLSVRIRSSGTRFARVLGWIDGIAEVMGR